MIQDDFLRNISWNKRIKVLRVKKGWTQSRAAKECFTTQKVFWLWENGLSVPRFNSRFAIAKAFDVSVEYIFGEGGEEKC